MSGWLLRPRMGEREMLVVVKGRDLILPSAQRREQVRAWTRSGFGCRVDQILGKCMQKVSATPKTNDTTAFYCTKRQKGHCGQT